MCLCVCICIGVVVEHSAAVNLWSSEMCALDCVYMELLPSLWVNTNTKTVLSAQCKPPKIGRTQPECSGHASIVMEVRMVFLSSYLFIQYPVDKIDINSCIHLFILH